MGDVVGEEAAWEREPDSGDSGCKERNWYERTDVTTM